MFAGVGFVATETEFETEQEAIREVDPRSSRVWKIKNPHSRNSVTGEHSPLLTRPSSLCPRRSSGPCWQSQVLHCTVFGALV